MFAKKFVTRTAISVVTALGLFGCASADGQSAPGEGQGSSVTGETTAKETLVAKDTEKATVTPDSLSLGAACGSACLAGFYRAEAGCAGNGNCIACAENAEQACVARCEGRTPIWRPCEP